MRGSVYAYTKHGLRRWRVVLDALPDPLTRQRRPTTVRGFATKCAAAAFLRRSLEKVTAGTYNRPSRVTVAEYLERPRNVVSLAHPPAVKQARSHTTRDRPWDAATLVRLLTQATTAQSQHYRNVRLGNDRAAAALVATANAEGFERPARMHGLGQVEGSR